MIRALRSTDMPDLLALLHWMDDDPDREVFAPSARETRELQLEQEDSTCFVFAGDEGVTAYCAIAPFRDGMVLEGPLGAAAHLSALLKKVLPEAEGLPVYAFCARDNAAVRDALEGAGLTPMHSTAFYSAPLDTLKLAALPDAYTLIHELPLTEYRALYKSAEDTWAGRLAWTPEQYDAHFAQEDVKLLALRRDGQPVAFAELELHPDEARAEVTHLAVHPAERGHGLGRLMLSLTAAEAAQHPEIRTLRVRAHDHMKAARALYSHLGFQHSGSIVTYLLESEEEA